MRGGARPGAGRKSNAELAHARDALRESISDKQWQALIKALYTAACKGNLRAAELLFRYNYGDPYLPDPSPEESCGPIQYIEVIDPRTQTYRSDLGNIVQFDENGEGHDYPTLADVPNQPRQSRPAH